MYSLLAEARTRVCVCVCGVCVCVCVCGVRDGETEEKKKRVRGKIVFKSSIQRLSWKGRACIRPLNTAIQLKSQINAC